MEFIIDPVTKQKFKLLSFEGRQVLKNLINSYMEGGSRTWDDEIKIASNKCNLRLRSIGERYPGLAEKLGDLKKWTNLGFGKIYEQACVFRHEDGTLMFEFLDLRASRRTRDAHPREQYFIYTTKNPWWKWDSTENNWNTTEPPRYSRAK